MTPKQLQQVKRELQAQLDSQFQGIQARLDTYFQNLEKRIRPSATTKPTLKAKESTPKNPPPEKTARERKKSRYDADVMDFLRRLEEEA